MQTSFNFFKIFALSAIFVGCASASRLAYDGGAAAAGGTVAYLATDGDPIITAASAAGAALLSEGVQEITKNSAEKDKTAYYEKGLAVATKRQYWIIQNSKKPTPTIIAQNQTKLTKIPYTRDKRTVDGVNFKETTDYIIIEENK